PRTPDLLADGGDRRLKTARPVVDNAVELAEHLEADVSQRTVALAWLLVDPLEMLGRLQAQGNELAGVFPIAGDGPPDAVLAFAGITAVAADRLAAAPDVEPGDPRSQLSNGPRRHGRAP